MKRILLFVIIGALISVAVSANGDGEERGSRSYVTIGTGGVTGVYYPAGGAVSRMVNKKSDVYNLKVTVESTGGSVYNVNGIVRGDLEFGIVQSDRQYQAHMGLAEWEGDPQEDLRAVFALHPESITLLASDKSGIWTLADLRGKVVNIGNPGSGNRGNAIDVLTSVGIDPNEDIQAEGLQAVEAAAMIQDGRIDAYFYTVGHPSGSFKEATAGSQKVHFVPIEGAPIDELIASLPFYAKSIIPVKANYPAATNLEDVSTFGVKATLCTSVNVPEEVVYAIAKEVFENLEEFKALHPAFAVLSAENMLEGLSAPIHPGALRYYQEVGLLE